jgi:stage V sporulation protein R
VIDPGKAINGNIYLVHHFEGKPLVKDYITNTMLGIEYLWGAPVQLETSEVVQVEASKTQLTIPGLTMPIQQERKEKEIKWQRVRYTMKNRRLSKEVIEKQN